MKSNASLVDFKAGANPPSSPTFVLWPASRISAALGKSASFSLRQTDTLRERGIAELIAKNRLSELRAAPRQESSFRGPGVDRESVTMAGKDWELIVTTESTENELMRRINVQVAREADPDSVVAELTGFLGRY